MVMAGSAINSGLSAGCGLTRGLRVHGAGLRVGMDIVHISEIARSLSMFGDRFVRRLFSAQEASYAAASCALMAERLAARFAAKEAT